MSLFFLFLLSISVNQMKCNTDEILNCQDLSERDEFENEEFAILRIMVPPMLLHYKIEGPSSFSCISSSDRDSDKKFHCRSLSCDNGTIVAAVIPHFRRYHAGIWNFQLTYMGSVVDHKIEVYETEYDENFHNRTIEVKNEENIVMRFHSGDNENKKCILINEGTNESYNLNDVGFRYPKNETKIRHVNPCGFRMIMENKTQGDWSLVEEFGWTRHRAHFRVRINSSIVREISKRIMPYGLWTEGFEGSFFDLHGTIRFQGYVELENPGKDIFIIQELSTRFGQNSRSIGTIGTSQGEIHLGPISSEDGGIWKIREQKRGSAYLSERDLTIRLRDSPFFRCKLHKDPRDHSYSLDVDGQILNSKDLVKGCTVSYGNESLLGCKIEPNYHVGRSHFHISIPTGIIDDINNMKDWEISMDHVIFHLKALMIGRNQEDWKTYVWYSRQMEKYVNRGNTLKVKCVANEVMKNCSLVSPQGTIYIQRNSSFVTDINCGQQVGNKTEKICGCKATIGNVNDEHNGTWTCKMSFAEGPKVESSVLVQVTESDLIPGIEQTISNDRIIKLFCRLSPAKRYRKIIFCTWFHRNEAIKDNPTKYIVSENDRKCSLEVKSPSEEDIGFWECSVRLDLGGYRNATVKFPKILVKEEKMDEEPEIDILNGLTNKSGEKQVMVGGILNLTCAASISNFTDEINWKNIDSSRFNLTDRIKMIRRLTISKYIITLYINPVEKTDEKIYTCDIVQRDGNKDHIRANYTITVHEPKLLIFDNKNMSGTQSNFTINVKGNPPQFLSNFAVEEKQNQTTDNYRNGNSNNDTASAEQPFVNISYTRTQLLLIVILITTAFFLVLVYYCTIGKKNLKRKVIDEETAPPSLNGVSVSPSNPVEQVIEEETAPRIPNEVSVDPPNPAEQVIDEETAPRILEEVSVSPSNLAEQVIEKEAAPPFLKRISAGLQHPGDLVYQDNHILSYNRDKWEYPFEKLILRNDLGKGYFGFVMKATAPNILGDGNDRTRVAAKGIQPDSKFSESRAITIEVRILANLGKHPNIVDFLGACTENIPYRTIYVLLEYCRLGSLSAYIKKHKSKFTNKIEIMICGKKDPSLGKFNEDIEEVADELESAENTVRSSEPFAVFDADGNLRTPDLSPISYNSDDFMRHGGINPRSNEPMPFSTGDLLTWSSQVAHGMEFLSEKKILHGDLAARNVLLSDNRTAKICDFGLARSMEFTGYYHSEISYHLPLLSSPIEAIESRLLSTKSDVWAFGILVWELLTLGERPYSTLYPMSKHFLLKFLKRGDRLEKPSYATDRTYRMMRHCWEEEPSDRPSFSELIEELKNILDEKLTCE